VGKEASPHLQERTALARPHRRDASALSSEAVVCLWAWLVMAGCFVGLMFHATSGHIARTDLRLLDASRHLPASFGRLVDLQTYIGTPVVLAPCIALLALVLFLRRSWLEAFLTLSAFGVFALVVLLKHLIAEPPPFQATYAEYQGIFESNYSFPSGHVAGVGVLFGLIFVFADRLTRDRGLAFVLRVVALWLIATVGPGRIWLEVHYPSDVVASYLLTAMFLLPVWFCCSARRRTMRRQDGT
jgi:undecaprenyl-diphosphatase